MGKECNIQIRTFVLFNDVCYSNFMPRAQSSVRPTPVKNKKKPLQRQARGLRTREAILARAVDIASVEGLEGLTEELQLATVEAARLRFIDKVTAPAICATKGMPRLWRLIDFWLSSGEKSVFKGGCFFSAASFEFDSRRGPVRDRVSAIMREWIEAIARAVKLAQEAGHLDPKLEATRLAFELHAIAMSGHWAHQLLDDTKAYARARAIALDKLRSVATAGCPQLP